MRIIGIVLAVVMVAVGGFLAFAGLGYIGASSGTSASWAILGPLLASFGIALAITVVRGPR